MTVVSRNRASSPSTWAAYGAAVWALGFSGLHVVWAAGWYVGLNEESARRAFQQRWFMVYDLAVAVVCVVGAAVALALVRPWGRWAPHRLVAVLAWFGTGLLTLRGGAGVLQAAYFAATRGVWSMPSIFWEIWFVLGAVLFGWSTWRFGSAARPRGV